MTTTINIITSVVDNQWNLEFSLNEDADIPRDVFIFENTGSGIANYQGVCSLGDFRRFQTHVPGVDVPIFGNKYLKYSTGFLAFPIEKDPKLIKDKIIADVKAFKAAYTSGESSSETSVI